MSTAIVSAPLQNPVIVGTIRIQDGFKIYDHRPIKLKIRNVEGRRIVF
jgi:hypothetical protein